MSEFVLLKELNDCILYFGNYEKVDFLDYYSLRNDIDMDLHMLLW